MSKVKKTLCKCIEVGLKTTKQPLGDFNTFTLENIEHLNMGGGGGEMSSLL